MRPKQLEDLFLNVNGMGQRVWATLLVPGHINPRETIIRDPIEVISTNSRSHQSDYTHFGVRHSPGTVLCEPLPVT